MHVALGGPVWWHAAHTTDEYSVHAHCLPLRICYANATTDVHVSRDELAMWLGSNERQGLDPGSERPSSPGQSGHPVSAG